MVRTAKDLKNQARLKEDLEGRNSGGKKDAEGETQDSG